MTVGCLAQVAVSVWPGVLYATTFYKQDHADLRSIFWEFEISIWLNAICRLISLGIFAVAMCRIGDCIKSLPEKMTTNGSMICLNWTLLVLMASVQVSLMIFYSLGLVYEENEIFKQYTVIMMYVNVVCTCASQVILSFIFSLMSEPLEILEVQNKNGETLTWEIRRDCLQIFRQECPAPPNYHESKVNNDLREPLHGGDASVIPTGINRN